MVTDWQKKHTGQGKPTLAHSRNTAAGKIAQFWDLQKTTGINSYSYKKEICNCPTLSPSKQYTNCKSAHNSFRCHEWSANFCTTHLYDNSARNLSSKALLSSRPEFRHQLLPWSLSVPILSQHTTKPFRFTENSGASKVSFLLNKCIPQIHSSIMTVL